MINLNTVLSHGCDGISPANITTSSIKCKPTTQISLITHFSVIYQTAILTAYPQPNIARYVVCMHLRSRSHNSRKRLLPQPPRFPPLQRTILLTRPSTQQKLLERRPRLMSRRRRRRRRKPILVRISRFVNQQARGAVGCSGCEYRCCFGVHSSFFFIPRFSGVVVLGFWFRCK